MAKVLTVIPYYNLVPPQNGGALRCFYLLRELAREHEVHAVVLQEEAGLRQFCDAHDFPDSLHIYGAADSPPPSPFRFVPGRLGPALHYRWLRRSWRGPANECLLRIHHLLAKILGRHRIDVVVFEHLSAMMSAPVVRRLSPRSVRILDAHNIDHLLLEQESQYAGGSGGGRKARKVYKQTRWYETNLSRYVHAFFACSEEDHDKLASLNPGVKGAVVPNGVDTSARRFDAGGDKGRHRNVLFCGSLDYAPNRDGLLWFHHSIWPMVKGRLPGVTLTIIGRGGRSGGLDVLRGDPSVNFVGEVDDVVPYYERSSISVVPLRMGSGTRLKVLEAMSSGTPLVSTTLGASGIAARHNTDILIADEPSQFARALTDLLTTESLFQLIRGNARKVAEGYDWQAVGKRMNETIGQLLMRERFPNN